MRNSAAGVMSNHRYRPQSVTIATFSCVPGFNTYRIRGVIQGQRVMILIDGGETLNFIDATLVTRRGIPTKDFDGFSVEVADWHIFPCVQKVP